MPGPHRTIQQFSETLSQNKNIKGAWRMWLSGKSLGSLSSTVKMSNNKTLLSQILNLAHY